MPTTAVYPTPAPGLGVAPMHAKAPLRRAVYVHLSDLLSAYNIDHSKLEEELKRVKVKRDKTVAVGSSGLGVPTELDTNSSQKRLQPPRGGFNICVLVGAVDIVVDKKRVDGSRVRLAEVEVGDETGRVSLRARDDQIDLLREVSDRAGAVVLRNCTLELFQGKHIRLAVTKWGKIAPYPDHIASTPVPPSKMNEDRFFSLIDLSVVAIDASVHSQGEGYAQSADNESTGFSNASGGGRGRNAGRKQPRPNKPMAPYPVSAPVGYADGNMMRFQGGLHGYGYVENLDSYGYRQRQPEHMASAQMLLQQQYEMHQRQIQQMYHDNRQPHGPADPSNPSTMHAAGMPPAASFEGGFGVPPRGDVFVNHGMSPQPNVFQQSPGHHGTPDRGQPNVGSHFPVSPRMNPRAATFDPNTPGTHGGHG